MRPPPTGYLPPIRKTNPRPRLSQDGVHGVRKTEKLWPLSHRTWACVGNLRINISLNGDFAMNSISQSGHVIGKRFGLGRDAVFRLWKAAIKDDEALLDEAITQTYERM